MISWTLSRYFFIHYVKITLFVLGGVFFLSLLMDFTENIGRLAHLPGYTPLGVLAVSMLRIPFIMQRLCPFVALFSAMTAFMTLNRRLELVITRSIGISAWQFLLPACFGAFLFGLGAILIVNPLAAWGTAQSKNILANWRGSSSLILERGNRIPWLTQQTDEGITTIGAKMVINGGRTLVSAIFIRFNDDQTIQEWLNAGIATLKNGYWQLSNVTRYKLGSHPENFDEIRISTEIRPEFVEERLADPSTIPFYELPLKIKIAKSFGYPARTFDMHLQSIIALPALFVAMTLIASTVSLKFTRLGQSGVMILGGILAGFLVYVIIALVRAFGDAGYVSPIAAAWIPVLIPIFLGISFLLHKEDG
ncbi:MAG: lipopolysaccharide export system permease protein [Candidatus Tokpelaia sp. JSC085]|nr:MAG: lipopolysaccharide export system permease protein [Candidatus Tokpelaia sp. JSC085]